MFLSVITIHSEGLRPTFSFYSEYIIYSIEIIDIQNNSEKYIDMHNTKCIYILHDI